ncbi:iron ABC transporter permease [Mobilibacterium timonense]|uniref:FecCD family ABC transporter permease n=1 Tax=Mobilibacterium timonense TaxID=1871012 RepID=UPI002ED62853
MELFSRKKMNNGGPGEIGGRKGRYAAAFVILFVFLIVLVVANICLGTVSMSFHDLTRALAAPGADGRDIGAAVIWKIRMPRLAAVFFLGGALSVSGFLLQTFFNNPIAGPYVLGISSGAKMVVAAVMIMTAAQGLILMPAAMIIAAFAGSMAAMFCVLGISRKVSNSAMLIVGGVMTGYICSAVTDFMVTFADDSSIVNLRSWSMGSFSGMSWESDRIIAVTVIAASVAAFLMSKPIRAYQMGEGYARSMGVDIRTFRFALVILSSLLSAVVTAFAGPVSFVGVAVPHLVRSLFGTSKPLVVIPGCFLCGADFCLLCDLIARTAFSPLELSISSVTAIFGAPVVIWVMIKRRKEK